MSRIVNCLWFDRQAEEAARFYISIFKDGKMGPITRYGQEGREIHGGEPGAVMTAEFEAAGQKFLGLNGGPHYQFNPAISFQVMCQSQAEIDYYWEKLQAGGGAPGQCGWLTDKYGVSWQVVPEALLNMLKDKQKGDAVMKVMLQMTKLDLAPLEAAYKTT